MKRILFCMLAMLVVFALTAPAHAVLINRGTDTLGNRLIYDDDRQITWYDFSKSPGIWSVQRDWALALSVTFNTTTYDDWRLPTAFNGDGSPPTSGFNADSEMGHLYYDDDALDIDGVGSLNNASNFQNLISSAYWSGTEADIAGHPTGAWAFVFSIGLQDALDKGVNGNVFYALAVRSGDVAAAPVPEPATIALLGIGLAGMAVYGIRRRRQLR